MKIVSSSSRSTLLCMTDHSWNHTRLTSIELYKNRKYFFSQHRNLHERLASLGLKSQPHITAHPYLQSMTDDICNHTRLTSIVTSSIELCTGIIGIKITDSYLVSQHTPIYLYDGSFCVLKLFYCWIGGGCCLVVNYFGSNILMGVETKMVSENLRNANSMQIPQHRYYVSRVQHARVFVFMGQ